MNDQSNPPTPLPFNMEKRVQLIRQFEARIKLLKKEFQDKSKPYDEAARTLRNEVLGWMQQNNLKNVRTTAGTPYEYTRTSWRIEDIDAFKRHVIGAEDWDLLQWHCSKTVADTRFNADRSIPPGVLRDASIELGIKPPVKPKPKAIKEGRPLTDEEWAQIEKEVDQELEEGTEQQEY